LNPRPPRGDTLRLSAAPLDPVEPARAEAESHGGGLTGERRHLTVLIRDLVGSTALAAQLDPEEWRAIVADYHRAAADAIERFGGCVAHYLGDGVMAYFGYPEAHDNDAERPAHAGLAILDAIAKLNELTARQQLSARVGIDLGAVVMGATRRHLPLVHRRLRHRRSEGRQSAARRVERLSGDVSSTFTGRGRLRRSSIYRAGVYSSSRAWQERPNRWIPCIFPV
jgi:adenylate/guanylate cyclase family protein